MDYGYASQYARTPNYYDSSSVAAASGIAAFLGAMMTFIMIFGAIWYVLQVISMWKIFAKAGEAGWKSLIPIYNMVVLLKISGITPWILLAYLLIWIPFIGGLIGLGITIYLNMMLAKSFGKTGGFAVGLILLSSIFYLILGFGDSAYVGPGGNTQNTSTEA